MAQRKQRKSSAGKLQGQKVALVGKFSRYGGHDLDSIQALVTAEGGTLVDGLKDAPDLLVAGAGVGGNAPAAVAKIQKKHPGVQVLDLAGFYQLTNPTADELRQLISSGKHNYGEFWSALCRRLEIAGTVLDLSGSDFRNCKIIAMLCDEVCVDGCDCRGAKISGSFGKMKGTKFDGTKISGAEFSQSEDCSFKNAIVEDVYWGSVKFLRCDFSAARLTLHSGYDLQFDQCLFVKADLCGSELEQTKFLDCDLHGAKFQGAKLEQCVFSRSNLSRADLSKADLRGANFSGADLRQAKFKDALLYGAELSTAIIDGADFTGANLTDVNVSGLDLSAAKNLAPKPRRTAGPRLLELAKVARDSKQFETTIEVRLGEEETVTLEPSVRRYGSQAYAYARYSHNLPEESRGDNIDVKTFQQGMLDLADLWSRGTPRFETISVKGKKCPLRGEELQSLAVAAWYEAFGQEVPSDQELQQAAKQSATESASLRETMIAELHGGRKGVANWNKRSDRERAKLGKLRKHDFSQAQLAKVDLNRRDLEGCTFDGAHLSKASLVDAQLKGASFVHANLTGANLAGSKSAEANFEGATLVDCHAWRANFRGCNFMNAVLTKAELGNAELGGANFTNANLDGVTFSRTKFDEKTVLPAGFVPPEGMEWKGIGPRPGTAAPAPPPPSGTLDFETFLVQLGNKVEAARTQKAASMLKAERFQLFAEVKEDSLVGIVKSQTSKDLVYSCRLASSGAFGCCTQNLRPCGGLRGALCKHLLVLIVGLAKAGQLDSAIVDHWIDLSRTQKPAIDEEIMSATFLRYKGAEAGEIDWRPTETIPEDFYTM